MLEQGLGKKWQKFYKEQADVEGHGRQRHEGTLYMKEEEGAKWMVDEGFGEIKKKRQNLLNAKSERIKWKAMISNRPEETRCIKEEV